MNYNLLNEWERRNVNKLTQKVLMKKIKTVDQNVAQTLKVCILTKGCFLKYNVKISKFQSSSSQDFQNNYFGIPHIIIGVGPVPVGPL